MPFDSSGTAVVAPAVAQANGQGTASANVKQQRAWSFESSYLDMFELEEYLDNLPNFENYRLEQGADRIILFATRDLTEEEAKRAQDFSGRVYSN